MDTFVMARVPSRYATNPSRSDVRIPEGAFYLVGTWERHLAAYRSNGPLTDYPPRLGRTRSLDL